LETDQRIGKLIVFQ